MSWWQICLTTAKWTTALWAGVVASLLFGVAVSAALGGLCAGLRRLRRALSPPAGLEIAPPRC